MRGPLVRYNVLRVTELKSNVNSLSKKRYNRDNPQPSGDIIAEGSTTIESNLIVSRVGLSSPKLGRKRYSLVYVETHSSSSENASRRSELLGRKTNQVPFTSVTLGMDTSEKARRITKGILNAYDAGLGHGEQPLDYAGLSAGMRR